MNKSVRQTGKLGQLNNCCYPIRATLQESGQENLYCLEVVRFLCEGTGERTREDVWYYCQDLRRSLFLCAASATI